MASKVSWLPHRTISVSSHLFGQRTGIMRDDWLARLQRYLAHPSRRRNACDTGVRRRRAVACQQDGLLRD